MRRRAGQVTLLVVLLIGGLLMLLPLLWGLVGAVQTPASLMLVRPGWWPHDWQWGNLLTVWHRVPLARALGNSVWVTSLQTAGQMLTAILTAYAGWLLPPRGRRWLYAAVLVLMAIPGEALMIPNFVFMARFGQLNHYSGLILPFLVNGAAILVLTNSFRTVPPQIIAAARVDGVTRWQLLWRVLVPATLPMIGVLTLMNAIGNWNAFLWPLISTNDPAVRTAPVIAATLAGEMGSNLPLVLAASWWVTLPPLLAYVVLQRWFHKNIER